jgi:predicted RNA-binding Zn ribbon-like protein
VDRWPLHGGAPCLDFANTVGWRPTSHPFDGLRTYDDLIEWGRNAALLAPWEADRLRAQADIDRPGTTAILRDAVALREAIFRLFVALAHGAAIDAGDLATIETVWQAGLSRSALARDADDFAFRLPDDADALARPLWKLAASAAQLLVSGDWRRVRLCQGDDCGWLFLDTTRNGSRRWCDSATCGNRARVRAHYQRRAAARRQT